MEPDKSHHWGKNKPVIGGNPGMFTKTQLLINMLFIVVLFISKSVNNPNVHQQGLAK